MTGFTPAQERKGIVVNDVHYTVLELLGKGGTSQVFRVLSPEGEVLALKQVRLDMEPAEAPALLTAVQNEIELMVRFREEDLNKFIIKLVDAEVKHDEQVVFMVMEVGEIDFAGMLKRHWEERRAATKAAGADAGPNENFVCHNWEQMLQAVHAMHEIVPRAAHDSQGQSGGWWRRWR